jgi:cell division protein FtsQ
MDGGGRLAQPLKGMPRKRARVAPAAVVRPPAIAHAIEPNTRRAGNNRLTRFMNRWSALLEMRVPRGCGLAATAAVILASATYGMVKGDHVATVLSALKDARDGAANTAGFRITSIALAGNLHVSREEVLAAAGVTGKTSLPFLDVVEARERLKTNPWIADATVLKLYPGELQIGIKEREAFALWQKDGRVSVIADDGTVLEPYVAPHLLGLPLVVGSGAQLRAKEFLALLEPYPGLRDFVRAAVLVAERRWNLRLKNGIDVELPETGVAAALKRFVALDREKSLITRDIVAIDLRLPDRITVRLSDAAAQARADALKEKDKSKKKGDSA